MKTADQVMSAVEEATGLNVQQIISSFVGAKAAND